MDQQDAEIERLRAGISCATVLERLPSPWRLDRAQSSRQNLKYRRGDGEILIVNHDGRGWWDPLSAAKGDIFTLVRRLDPGLSFGDACRLLRGFAGSATPAPPALLPVPAHLPVAERWARRRPLSRGSPVWTYLAQARGLPEDILIAARLADAVREGPRGSAWFAHRDGAGVLTGIEMRGPDWRGFSAGGGKTLFRLAGGPGRPARLAVCEAAIDALSLAAIEGARPDTLYAATAGGMGPGTLAAFQPLFGELAAEPAGLLVAATDADPAGCRFAARLADLAAGWTLAFARLLPPDGLNDWNDALRAPTADHRSARPAAP
jgi:hypothetical protein